MTEQISSETGAVRLVKAHEPRLDIRPDREMVALMGAANISTRGYSADSASSGQIVWSQTTPSVRVGVDRTIEADVTFRVEVAGLPEDYGLRALLNGVNFGLRQYPLHSVVENLQLRLNDQAFNWEPADTVHALMRYGNDWQDRQYGTGSTPHQPDTRWGYDQTIGGPRNVFSSWEGSGQEDSRRLRQWVKRINDTVFEVRMIEQLYISPLAWGDECQALFGIQNIDVLLTLRAKLLRMFAGDLADLFEGAVPGAPNLTEDQLNLLSFDFTPVQTQCKLHITYLQPHADQVVPFRLNYPYNQIRRFQNPQTTFVNPVLSIDDAWNPRNTFDVNYNNITLHEIPKRMYVFAQPSYNSITQGQRNVNITQMANFWASIQNISVNFDSQDGRLSTLDKYDLWKISTRNGLKMSYLDWAEELGSVLCLEFGKDLNLNPLLCPSVRGNFQLSLNVRFEEIRNKYLTGNFAAEYYPDNTGAEGNPERGAVKYTPFLVIVPTGIVTIENQLITTSIGSITEEQVMAAPWLPTGFRQGMRGIYGSGFDAKNVFGALKKAAKVVGPAVSPVLGLASDVVGMSNDPKAQMASGVLKAVSKVGKGRRSGGAQARCASLARRM